MFRNVYKLTTLNVIMSSDLSISKNFYVSKDWLDKVEKYCDTTARNPSKLIQLAVEKYMEDNN